MVSLLTGGHPDGKIKGLFEILKMYVDYRYIRRNEHVEKVCSEISEEELGTLFESLEGVLEESRIIEDVFSGVIRNKNISFYTLIEHVPKPLDIYFLKSVFQFKYTLLAPERRTSFVEMIRKVSTDDRFLNNEFNEKEKIGEELVRMDTDGMPLRNEIIDYFLLRSHLVDVSWVYNKFISKMIEFSNVCYRSEEIIEKLLLSDQKNSRYFSQIEINLLAKLALCFEDKELKSLLFYKMEKHLPIDYLVEVLYQISVTNPGKIGYIFYRNAKKLKTSKYSHGEKMAKIRKNSWDAITWKERIKTMILP